METTVELGWIPVPLMRDEGDMLLMLGRFDKSANTHYHNDFHVGFNLETREEVELYRKRAEGSRPSTHWKKLGWRFDQVAPPLCKFTQ